ncbi:uncharacterized protein LTR77_004052 [Saxophila tyrrhenica]|uniref:BZIP domain-containing protein n=1 Tax=Saxophila tyrrhenica TaxID=1690608 RepID=A0AAV9PFX0_9PEZI|nr:hypothetical protein LTR77_004052 [Saxophila tyrrhenica]
MTCVVSSPWHSFNNSTYGWSPMNPEDSITPTSAADRTQYGYISSESESRLHSSGGSKKRASRAGTRSVSTLSAAQLERKRANDREAQRAIRQRTKDHIEHLERNISDLRAAHESSEKIAAVAHQRSRELEEENGFLRSKLGEFGYSVPVPPPSESQRPPDQHMIPMHATSPGSQVVGASIPRPPSTSTPRSALSVTTSQSSNSRHGSWQQGATHLGVSGASAPASLPAHSSVQLGPGLTSWRSQDSTQSVHSTPGGMPEQHSLHTQVPYVSANPADRPQWSVRQPYPYQEPQRTPSQTQAQASPQPQPQYAQPQVPNYPPGAAPQPQSYVAPPQSEFQSMTVQSPANYQVSQQQPYPPQQHYQMAPVEQVPPTAPGAQYAPQPGQLHPPQIIPAAYQHPQGEQGYAQQQMHAYREDPGQQGGYSMTHYPSG